MTSPVPKQPAPGRAPRALVLFHGAGSDRDYETLQAVARSAAERNIETERVNFPYRQKGPGRRPPDRMPKLMAAVHEAVTGLADRLGCQKSEVVIGGHSMGGRAASMVAADGFGTTAASVDETSIDEPRVSGVVAGNQPAGLVLLSYPLHPQGNPEALRVDHFDRIHCPVLLIQGNKDRLGTPEEFALHLPTIPGHLDQIWLDGGHDLRRHDDDIARHVGRWLGSLGASD